MAGGASVNDGWTETGREHLDLCRRMTAHVQCSFAESFCYAAGDAIVCGLPVVGSPAIPWLPDAWRMTNAADPRELAIRVLDAPDWNPQDGRDALDRYNRTAAPLALLGFDLCDNAGEAERVSAVALQQKGKP